MPGVKLPFSTRSEALCFPTSLTYVECALLSATREPEALICYYECEGLSRPLVTKEFSVFILNCPNPWLAANYNSH